MNDGSNLTNTTENTVQGIVEPSKIPQSVQSLTENMEGSRSGEAIMNPHSFDSPLDLTKRQMPNGMKPQRLTVKQKLFAQEYVANRGNGTQAALKVYDVKNADVANTVATENIRKPLVAEEIQRGFEKAGLSKEKVFEKFTEATLAGIGEKAKNSDSIKGFETLFKLFNWFPNNIKRSQHESIKYVFDGKSDKELNDLAMERAKRIQQNADTQIVDVV